MNQADYKSPLSKEGPVLLTSSLLSDTKDDIMMELLQDLKSLLTNTHHSLRFYFQLNIYLSMLFKHKCAGDPRDRPEWNTRDAGRRLSSEPAG